MKLHVDRPCRVARVRGRWQWRCLCTPDGWSYTGAASSWLVAYAEADSHVRLAHADESSYLHGLTGAQGTDGRDALVIDLSLHRNRRRAATGSGSLGSVGLLGPDGRVAGVA